jgi:hypothetical protein
MEDFKIIQFTFAGLHLQEPSTFISDFLLAIISLYISFRIFKLNNKENAKFLYFYIFLFISTLFGAFGHVLFYYFGVLGKFPSWFFASIATFYFCTAVLEDIPTYFNLKWKSFIWFKAILLLLLSLIFTKFIFVAIDSIISYVIFGGILSYLLWNQKRIHMKYLVYGTILLVPSIFVFVLDVNLHALFNKNDLSHLFILMAILFYYKAILERNKLNINCLILN